MRAAGMELADKVGLPYLEPRNLPEHEPDLILVVGPDRLELRETGTGAAGPVYVDFIQGPVGYRRRSVRSRRQPLAMAVGLRKGPLTVVDATAGLGRDSFILACLGCRVIAIERSPVLAALIEDGLGRANAKGTHELRAVLERMALVVGDARDILPGMREAAAPDVVYLDPMYPPRKKRMQVGKEMRISRRVVGDDSDSAELLAVARRVARRRVAVKRHKHAPPIAPDPALQFRGKQVRYDVYLPTEKG
jgi:16S rRNA (guanine1516-N2)-methyltransferase